MFIQKVNGTKKSVLIHFRTMSEVIQYIKDTPLTGHYKDIRDDNNPSWSGWKNEDDLFEKVFNYREQEVYAKLDKANSYASLKKRSVLPRYDLSGHTPDVARYLSGDPCHMINDVWVRKPTRIIPIYYRFTDNCSRKAERYTEAIVKLAEKILTLELQGYRVRLNACSLTRDQNEREFWTFVFPIKDEGQPMAVSTMLFPLGHAAMQRGVIFMLEDRVPEVWYSSGRGRTTDEEFFRKKLLEHLPPESLYITLDDVLGGELDAKLEQYVTN